MRRITALLLAVLTVLSLAPPAGAAAPEGDERAVVLFTHDMHSHFLPADDGAGGTYGGYARLKRAIDLQRSLHPDAVLVDGGDFAMGSLFQTGYATSALELRAMGAMGYDAATFGNHEYDYGPAGLASMLNAAADSGDPLPALVECNYFPPSEGEEGYNGDSRAVWDAFQRCGVSSCTHFQRGGIPYAIFGLMGEDSHACAPSSGMVLYDRFEAAQQTVDKVRQECVDEYGMEPVVICLSHSGTDGQGGGEDVELAQKVEGIHLIISGHTHTTLTEPLEVDHTYIVSCGCYTEYLGAVTLDRNGDGGVTLADYQLIPLDDAMGEDGGMAAWVEQAKRDVEAAYLSRFGLSFDQVLVQNPYSFESVNELYASHHDSPLGSLIADSYLWAAEQAEGQRADLALTASGIVRASLPSGKVTASDAFNADSLGIGADGVPGYPLVAAYLTGRDLKSVLEIDASVSSLMPAARLYFSGVTYTVNPRRMFFNRVTECALRRGDGTLEPIENDKLYRVVLGLYAAEMLGAVEKTSFGLISIQPRNGDGSLLDMENLEPCILRQQNGEELKEWIALASYLQSMGGEMDPRYAAPDGRKTISPSWNPIELLKNPNGFTFAALGAALFLALLVALIVKLIKRRGRRGTNRNGARGYTSYRGR